MYRGLSVANYVGKATHKRYGKVMTNQVLVVDIRDLVDKQLERLND